MSTGLQKTSKFTFNCTIEEQYFVEVESITYILSHLQILNDGSINGNFLDGVEFSSGQAQHQGR